MHRADFALAMHRSALAGHRAALVLAGAAMSLAASSSYGASPYAPFVKSGSLVHVSSVGPVDPSGVVQGDDVAAQTRRTLENLRERLGAAGTDLSRVASVMVYLRDSADFPAMNQAYAAFFPQDPPTRTTIVVPPADPKALLEVSAVALVPGAERRSVLPAGWKPSPNPYSYGILSGDTLFLSGLVARNPADNSFKGGDVATQTRAVLESAGTILKAAGMTHADVVSARVYLPDTSGFQAMNEAYRAFFPEQPPARATVQAGLAGHDYVVEITLLAVKSASRRAILTPNEEGTPGRANPNLSSAILVDGRLFLSGMLGNSEATKGDAAAQTRVTLDRLGRTLRAAGFDWEHVRDGIVYVTDVANRATVEGLWRERLGSHAAGVTVVTDLVAPDGLVEIMLTAAR
jgi:enamine deaminase RidA (YjgF/YER057c/UK114 family)